MYDDDGIYTTAQKGPFVITPYMWNKGSRVAATGTSGDVSMTYGELFGKQSLRNLYPMFRIEERSVSPTHVHL